MKTYLDCIPCFFRQALEAARLSGANEKMQKEILHRLAEKLPAFSLAGSPPEMGRTIYGLVREITRKKDPYRQIKAASNQKALRLVPRLKAKIKKARDPLQLAVQLAIAGNIIDYGVKNTLNVDGELERILKSENDKIRSENKKLFQYSKFKKAVAESEFILYLADNAGETVFDRLLIETIRMGSPRKSIIYAVKSEPTINDALARDARACGIDRFAKIVSNGLGMPGTSLSLCSPYFLRHYRRADMVISKGQGNFESLSPSDRPVCFLFMAKCPVVARDIRCRVGDIILWFDNGRQDRKHLRGC